MVFSSLYFLYLFLPVCLLCYGLSSVSKSTAPRNFVLTVFSLIFYAWGEPTFIIILLLSVLLLTVTTSLILRRSKSSLQSIAKMNHSIFMISSKRCARAAKLSQIM